MKNEVTVKRSMTPEAAADVLADLSASLRAGTVCVIQGEDFVTLTPGGGIDVGILAGRKKDKQKISIQMAWREIEVEAMEAAEFGISGQEPETNAPEPAETGEEAAPAVAVPPGTML
ncbi:MAG: amphi-Trp domain-containing protein [Desulfococcaceae bacterium]